MSAQRLLIDRRDRTAVPRLAFGDPVQTCLLRLFANKLEGPRKRVLPLFPSGCGWAMLHAAVATMPTVVLMSTFAIGMQIRGAFERYGARATLDFMTEFLT